MIDFFFFFIGYKKNTTPLYTTSTTSTTTRRQSFARFGAEGCSSALAPRRARLEGFLGSVAPHELQNKKSETKQRATMTENKQQTNNERHKEKKTTSQRKKPSNKQQ
jgi:hypothetical protein